MIIAKLEQSKLILEKNLSPYIESLVFEPKLARITIYLRNNVIIYIQFNDFGEYGYSIIFSKILLDRCRFDNYDDKWVVSTRPNHFHPRSNKNGYSSPMKGTPNHDMPILCELIKSGKFYSPEFRFKIEK